MLCFFSSLIRFCSTSHCSPLLSWHKAHFVLYILYFRPKPTAADGRNKLPHEQALLIFLKFFYFWCCVCVRWLSAAMKAMIIDIKLCNVSHAQNRRLLKWLSGFRKSMATGTRINLLPVWKQRVRGSLSCPGSCPPLTADWSSSTFTSQLRNTTALKRGTGTWSDCLLIFYS